MLKYGRGINGLIGCGVFSALMGAGYWVFLTLNGLASWVFIVVAVVFGFVSVLYFIDGWKEFGSFKKERIVAGCALLVLGICFIVADLLALRWFISQGFTELWLKNYAKAIVVWSVSMMIAGLWLLLAPLPKRKQVPCSI